MKGKTYFLKEQDVIIGFSWLKYGPVAANVLQVGRKTINSSTSQATISVF
jgi:hypothetical protein